LGDLDISISHPLYAALSRAACLLDTLTHLLELTSRNFLM